MALELREVLTYGPGNHEFRRASYPWLAAVRVGVQSGRGGPASDGSRSSTPPPFVFREIPVAELPDIVSVKVGRGGCEAEVTDYNTGKTYVSERGDAGIIVVELYEELPPPGFCNCPDGKIACLVDHS